VVPAKTSGKLLQLFYPPGCHWEARFSKVERGRLTARVVKVGKKEVTVRLSGDLDLRYPADAKPNDGRVKAKLVGQLRYRPTGRAITSFLLATDEGRYVRYWNNKPLDPVKVEAAVEAQR
jgi:hypothetical protein